MQEVDKVKVVLSHCFTKITLVENKMEMIKEIMNCFVKDETNVNIGKIWICLADELVSDLSVDVIENFEQFETFFYWPARNLQLLDEHMNKVSVRII